MEQTEQSTGPILLGTSSGEEEGEEEGAEAGRGGEAGREGGREGRSWGGGDMYLLLTLQ